jgi:chemotaxis signal transduction protein
MKMMKKAETSILLKQTNALGNYLDEMLHDATQLDSRTIDQPVKPLVKLESCERALLAEVSIEDSEESTVPNIIEITERNSVEVGFEVDSVEADLESYPSKLSNKIDISQFPIQCMMFRVGHNLLSLPLIEMNGVVQWTDELTQLPQSPDWVLGILKHRDTNLRVLDSSKVLGIPAIARQTPSHILILSDNISAISCDILEDVVTLEYNDIQWQPETGNALLHGTIRETLASLISPSGIIDSLNIKSEQ